MEQTPTLTSVEIEQLREALRVPPFAFRKSDDDKMCLIIAAAKLFLAGQDPTDA